MKKKLFIVFSVLLFVGSSTSAQNTTSRITVNKGVSVDVYFNHLDDYADGIILSGHTELDIYFNETDAGGNGIGDGWQLSIKPDGHLVSVFSADYIDINIIEVEVYDAAAGTTELYELENLEKVIASGTQNLAFTNTIAISYKIGVTNPINKVSNERYVALLEFTLEPKP
ncbi:MAG: hypothetical protein R6U85_12380 [Salinivirgaceae bacterium]